MELYNKLEMNKNSFTNLSYKAITPSHAITPRKKYPLLTTHQTTNSYSKSLSNIFLSNRPHSQRFKRLLFHLNLCIKISNSSSQI